MATCSESEVPRRGNCADHKARSEYVDLVITLQNGRAGALNALLSQPKRFTVRIGVDDDDDDDDGDDDERSAFSVA